MTDSFQNVVRDFRNKETNAKLICRDKTAAPRELAHKNEVERAMAKCFLQFTSKLPK